MKVRCNQSVTGQGYGGWTMTQPRVLVSVPLHRRIAAYSPVLLAALLLTACGTGGQSSDSTTTTTAESPTTTEVPATTTVPPTTTLPPTTTTLLVSPTADDLWPVYTEWAAAVATGEWDRAMELSTGPALEYVRMSAVLHEISPQDGWVFEADNGPTSDVLELNATQWALGGTVSYTGAAGRMEPADPVFEISGDQPLLLYWGAQELASNQQRLPFDQRIVTLGERTDACDFTPLWSYVGGRGEPSEDGTYQLIVLVDLCPGADWLPGFDEVTLSTASGSGPADGVAWDSSRRGDGSMPANTSSAFAVISAVERGDLNQMMTLDLVIAGDSQTITIPPMAKS